jgi:hypothetical protein
LAPERDNDVTAPLPLSARLFRVTLAVDSQAAFACSFGTLC